MNERPKENRLAIINPERTRLSIVEWNGSPGLRESLNQRERAKVRRKLIQAARKFGIEVEVVK